MLGLLPPHPWVDGMWSVLQFLCFLVLIAVYIRDSGLLVQSKAHKAEAQSVEFEIPAGAGGGGIFLAKGAGARRISEMGEGEAVVSDGDAPKLARRKTSTAKSNGPTHVDIRFCQS